MKLKALDIYEFAYEEGVAKAGISPRFLYGIYIPTRKNDNAHGEIRHHFRISFALGAGGKVIH